MSQAVLALVIERPSYAFELSKRFDQRFGDLLLVGSSRVYQVIDEMRRAGLIEPLAGEVPDGTERQPKVHYRATAAGAGAYRQRLAEDLEHDPKRSELVLRLLSTVTHDERALLDLVDRYEQACLDTMATRRSGRLVDAAGAPVGRDASSEAGRDAGGPDAPPREQLVGALIAEQRRLELDARLKWIAYARKRIRASAAARPAPATSSSEPAR